MYLFIIIKNIHNVEHYNMFIFCILYCELIMTSLDLFIVIVREFKIRNPRTSPELDDLIFAVLEIVSSPITSPFYNISILIF